MTTLASDVRPLADAPFGVELVLDPARPLGDAERDVLRTLLAKHHLLLVRGSLSEEAQIALVGAFGRVLPQGGRQYTDRGPEQQGRLVTYVSNTRPDGILSTWELTFHHDLAHMPTPIAGLSLYALDVAPDQSATRFADGAGAYRSLPEDLRRRLDGLQALFVAIYEEPMRASEHDVEKLDPTWPRAIHPIVVRHPVSGEAMLYLNEMQTASILGLDGGESRALLQTLLERLYDPANVYEHRWRTGDLVIWDNLALQHARVRVNAEAPRTLRRVVFGEKMLGEEWPNQVSTALD